MKKILAVETSCDDTGVAIVREDGFVECHLEAHQNSIHERHGGIIPELASRNHVYHLLPLIQSVLTKSQHSWEDISCLAVTNRPGLIGALMVGLVTVKTLALTLNKPFIVVNHVEGHLLSPFLWDQNSVAPPNISFPFLALIVSGAHTHLFIVKKLGHYHLIGQTVDDAAGEALDKIGREMQLGYPGGAKIDQIAQGVSLGTFVFPSIQLKNPLNFSFSGIKTSAGKKIQTLKKQKDKNWRPHLCADYQEAIIHHIVSRLKTAQKKFNIQTVVLAGGVSANSRLRMHSLAWAKKEKISLWIPPVCYCTDNAAMIAYAAFHLFLKKQYSSQDINCYPYVEDYE